MDSERRKNLIISALRGIRGDDYERAKAAFRGYTDRQLDAQYGASGETCRAILEGYRKHVEDVEEVIAWVKENVNP